MTLADFLVGLTPNPGLLPWLVGTIALIESLALVGLLVPGVVLMTAVASLAGHQQLSLAPLLLAALMGAVVGDGLSYWLGRTHHRRVTAWWPLSRHPEWLARGARFFQRYGTLSVFLGRFVGPVRPVVPLIAGMMRMPPKRFYLANLASAAIWAPAYVLPGYLLGHTWEQRLTLPEGARTGLLLLGISLVGMALVFSWLRQQAGRSGGLYRLGMTLARRHPVLRRLWLAHLERSGGEIPLASWLLLVFALGGLSAWTLVVMDQGDPGPLVLDRQIRDLTASLAGPRLMALSEGLARVGDLLGIVTLLLPWLAWLAWKGRRDAILHLLGGLAGVALLNTLGKVAFARPRPQAPAYLADSFAYPSAHASGAVVLFGLAAAFTAQALAPGHRHWAYWAAILAATLMALSRLVLGVHWASDLIGGALLGLVVCALVRLSWRWRPRAGLAPCPWPWLVTASLGLLAARIAWLPPV